MFFSFAICATILMTMIIATKTTTTWSNQRLSKAEKRKRKRSGSARNLTGNSGHDNGYVQKFSKINKLRKQTEHQKERKRDCDASNKAKNDTASDKNDTESNTKRAAAVKATKNSMHWYNMYDFYDSSDDEDDNHILNN